MQNCAEQFKHTIKQMEHIAETKSVNSPTFCGLIENHGKTNQTRRPQKIVEQCIALPNKLNAL